MKTDLHKSVVAIFCSLFLSLNLFASSIEISGTYDEPWEYDADTLLVVGNCNFNHVTLRPGTFILFKGDYTIKLSYLKSIGTETDSITFCGSLLPGDSIKLGSLYDYSFSIWQEPPSTLILTRLVNLKSVTVSQTKKCSFLECYSVRLLYSYSNKLLRNDIVRFDYSVDSCQVVENKLLGFSFYYDRWISQQYYFNCTNSTFLRNSSGLTTGGRGILYIENCRFIENAGPVVNYHVTSSDKYLLSNAGINYNKFYKNTGNILDLGCEEGIFFASIINNEFIENEGIPITCNNSSILAIYNNLFLKNRTSSGPGSVYYYNGGNDKPVTIKNNTFVANRGETFGCMEIISDTTCPINVIANNIFWDNSTTLSEYAVGINFLNTPSEVCELNLTHSVAMDTSKIALVSGAGFELVQKNSFNLSPEFVDSLNNNFRLSKVSPYIDAGTGTSGTEDLDGNPRIFGKAIDIGPYEYIPVSYPEILYQSGDTILFTGDSLILQIQTNDIFDYSWYLNNTLIAGEKDTFLTIQSASLTNSGKYKVRVCNLTDTIWSDPMNVHIYSFTRYILPDSLYLCPDSIEITADAEGVNYLWSTGETTQSITVKETGTYWVQLTDSLGLNLTDTVTVYRQTSMEISGTYTGTWEFCTDTLFVVGDCNFTDSLIIHPGTRVIFQDDYTITINFLHAKGELNDSIYFSPVGSKSTLNKGKLQVQLKDPYTCFCPIDITEYCVFRNLSFVRIVNPAMCKFLQCEYVYCDYKTDACYFDENGTLIINWEINNSIVKNTQILISEGHSGRMYSRFFITNCQFESNFSTLHITSDYIKIERSIFRNNYSTPISICDYMVPGYLYIANNCFYNNVSDEGSGALEVLNHVYAHDSLYLFNNTFYANSGTNCNSLLMNHSFSKNIFNNTFYAISGTKGNSLLMNHSFSRNIFNNIFWNSLPEIAPEIMLEGASTDSFYISSTIIRGGLEGISVMDDYPLNTHDIYSAYPEFIDSVNGNNLELQKISPAIDKGEGVFDATSIDLKKQPRVFGKSVDLGAYEYIPTSYPEFTMISDDTLVCLHDSVTLKALSDDIFNYNWYKNDQHLEEKQDDTLTILSLAETDTGYYQASINNLTDTVWSDPIHLVSSSAPVITDYTPAVEVCKNLEAVFSFETESELPPDYMWYSYSDGELEENTNVLYIDRAEYSDTLLAIATSVCGSDSTGEMLLLVLPLPEPDLGNDTTLYPDDSILLDAGEFESYLWSTGATERFIIGNGGDTLWVVVTDENTCAGSDTIIIYLHPVSTLEPISHRDLWLYPNPVSDVLYIQTGPEIELPYLVKIYCQDGRLLTSLEAEEQGIQAIKIGGSFAPGYYILQVQSDTFVGLGRFVVK
jgi:hypothetical protein